MSKYSKTPKMTSSEKLSFYKENGYWFGTTPKAILKVENVNHDAFNEVEEVKIMTIEERVSIEEMNISMRAKSKKNNL